MKYFGAIVLSFLFFAFSAVSQPPAPAELALLEEVYLAKDDGTGKPGVEATEFAPTDIPLHCVVVLGNTSSATVRMDLIAANVPGVRAGTKVVSTSYTVKDGQNQVYFYGKPHGLWVSGSYRADIYINGNLVRKLEFVVKGGAGPSRPGNNFQPKPAVKPRTAAKRT